MANTGEVPIAQVLAPDSFCFIQDLDSGGASDRLEFQLMPESIGESKSAIYNEIPILGRSLPLLGYAGSTSRQISLSISFAALYAPGSGGYYDIFWVQKQVRWLESKVYPEYRSGFTFPPHRLLVIMGQAVRMQAIMIACNTTWLGPWAIDHNEGQAYSHRATVDCQFQEFGMNDDSLGHPHDTTDALEGRNQADAQAGPGENDYVAIPLAAQQPVAQNTPGG